MRGLYHQAVTIVVNRPVIPGALVTYDVLGPKFAWYEHAMSDIDECQKTARLMIGCPIVMHSNTPARRAALKQLLDPYPESVRTIVLALLDHGAEVVAYNGIEVRGRGPLPDWVRGYVALDKDWSLLEHDANAPKDRRSWTVAGLTNYVIGKTRADWVLTHPHFANGDPSKALAEAMRRVEAERATSGTPPGKTSGKSRQR